MFNNSLDKIIAFCRYSFSSLIYVEKTDELEIKAYPQTNLFKSFEIQPYVIGGEINEENLNCISNYC